MAGSSALPTLPREGTKRCESMYLSFTFSSLLIFSTRNRKSRSYSSVNQFSCLLHGKDLMKITLKIIFCSSTLETSLCIKLSTQLSTVWAVFQTQLLIYGFGPSAWPMHVSELLLGFQVSCILLVGEVPSSSFWPVC